MHSPRRLQAGVTFLELTIVIAILSAMIVSFVPFYINSVEKGLAYQTSERARLIYENVKRYRVVTGGWPASPATLVSGNYISTTATTTGWGGDFTLTPVSTNLSMSFTLPSPRFVNTIAGKLPAPTISGNTITESISPAGQELSLAALQDLAGLREWTGNYQAGGNDLIDLGNLEATGDITTTGDVTADSLLGDAITAITSVTTPSLSATTATIGTANTTSLVFNSAITAGASCAGRQANVTSSGHLYSCVSGVWVQAVAPAASVASQLANPVAVINRTVLVEGWDNYTSAIGNYVYCTATMGGRSPRSFLRKTGSTWYWVVTATPNCGGDSCTQRRYSIQATCYN
jgi:type II secretory pathway pseudopilin PulG